MDGTRRTSAAVLLVAFGIAGCSEDPPPPVVFPDSGVQCANPADMAVLQAMRDSAPDGGVFEPALTVAMACGHVPACLEVLLQGEADAGYACIDSCMADMDPATVDLSDPCKGCFITYGLFCEGTFCLTDCLGDDHVQCKSCFEEQCAPMFDYCVGF